MLFVFLLLTATFPKDTVGACPCPKICYCDDSDMTCTDVTKIPDCAPRTVTNLYVRDSIKLDTIQSDNFDGYSQLRKIYIYNTGLKIIQEGAFEDCSSLQSLRIEKSAEFQNLRADAFEGLKNLRTLEITGCSKLTTVPGDAFSELTTLKNLNISGNDLKFVHEDALHGLDELRSFDISNNEHLESLPSRLLTSITTLQTIDMHDCELDTLYTEYFSNSLESLNQFRADGNPWDCGEEMCPFSQWLSDNTAFREIATLGQCENPSFLEDENLLYIQPNEVCSGNPYRVTLIVTGIVLIVVIFIIVCLLVVYGKKILRCCKRKDEDHSTRMTNDPTIRTNTTGIDNGGISLSNLQGDMCAAGPSQSPNYDSAAILFPKAPPPYDYHDNIEHSKPPPYQEESSTENAHTSV